MMKKPTIYLILITFSLYPARATDLSDPNLFGRQLRGLSMGMSTSEFFRLKNLRMFADMAQEKLTGSQFFDRVIYSFSDDSLRQIVLSKPMPCESAARQSRELIRQARKV